jgi:glycosyltransferase involved in cell wall biosynthesis
MVANRLDGEVFEGRAAEFVVIGPDDGMRENLETYVSENSLDNVSILGYLTEQEKNAALAAGDVFVLPSYSEGQPISVLEACAAGTPVVISQECSIPQVTTSNAGRVISTTTDELEKALRELLCDPAERQQCSRNARQMAIEEFSWEYVLDEIVSLYQSL